MIETQSDGGSVGHVIGFWQTVQFQFKTDCVLDLFFGSFTAAGQESLDLSCTVVNDGNSCVGHRHQNRPSGMCQQDGRLDIFGQRENLFDGDYLRLKFVKDFTQTGADFVNAFVQR